MSVHSDLHSRHQKVIPNWLALYYKEPIQIVEGKGSWVKDAEGKEYLDFFGGILTTMTGHSVPEVIEAIKSQADKVLHTSTLYLSEQMIELAEKIGALTNIKDPKVFFNTSGSEANDTALLLATIYRGSNEVLAMRNSYHGRSFTAQAITGNSGWTASSLSGLSVNFVHGSYRYRCPYKNLNDKDYIAASVEDLREVINVMTTGNVAALIAEPIQGVGGFCYPPDGMFKAFKEVLDETGILYISDEVQTGWGRTGENFWGYEAHDIVPDMMTFAKGVGNGMALAGVVASAEIMDCLGANSISTFGGNPLSCAGGLANLEYLLSNDLQTNSLKMGARLINGLNDLGERLDWIGDVRGKGLMLTLETVQPGTEVPNPEKINDLMEATLERGLLIGKGGLHGNCLRIAPPLSVNEEEIDKALEIITQSAEEV